MNKKTFIKVNGDIHNNCLCIKCHSDNDLLIKEKKITGDEKQNQNLGLYLIWWALNVVKPFFYSLPVDDIKVEISKECKERFGNIFTFSYNLLQQTDKTLKTYAIDKNCAIDYQTTLFFNVGENVNFKKIHDRVNSLDPEKTIYLDFDPGFNPIERKWEKTPPPMTVSAFVDYIKKNRIKKIVSINHYLLEKYFDEKLIIQALFKYLGVEYSIVDLDNYDLTPQGYLHKMFYNCDSFERFSYAEFHAFWDKFYGMKNVNRIAFTHEDRSEFVFQDLDDDYDIVVMSNSRIREVISFLNPMLFVLSNFKDGSFFEELELWYYSLRHMVLSVMDFNEFERLNYNALLLRFVYTISQFIKYDVIDNIQTDRQIKLYGDAGWKEVFPEYYVNFLQRNEIDNLLSNGKSLNLLMNWQLTWFETSAVIFEAIHYRVPFLNHPALVKTKKLQGMSFIEYHNGVDLNKKLSNIKPYLNDKLTASVNYLNGICNGNMDYIVHKLHHKDSGSIVNNEFVEEYQKHDKLLQQKINTYINQNDLFLRNSFKALFIEPVQYDLKQSKYYPKPFMQRILHFAHKNQQN
jgi:hypothetical protein